MNLIEWFEPPIHRLFVRWRWCRNGCVGKGWRTDQFFIVRGDQGWNMRAWLWGWWGADEIPVDAIMGESCPPSELDYEPDWECK